MVSPKTAGQQMMVVFFFKVMVVFCRLPAAGFALSVAMDNWVCFLQAALHDSCTTLRSADGGGPSWTNNTAMQTIYIYI